MSLILFGAHSSPRMMNGVCHESCDPVYDPWMQSVFTDILTTMQTFGPCGSHCRRTSASRTATACRSPSAMPRPTARIHDPDRRAGRGRHGVVDLHAFICPTGTRLRRGRRRHQLRPDGIHFKVQGADVVARWLLSQIGVRFDPSG